MSLKIFGKEIIETKLSLLLRWRFGLVVNALDSINEVTLRQARLVLAWVTVCGRVNHLGV